MATGFEAVRVRTRFYHVHQDMTLSHQVEMVLRFRDYDTLLSIQTMAANPVTAL